MGQACVRNWGSFLYYKVEQTLLQIGAALLLQTEESVVINGAAIIN